MENKDDTFDVEDFCECMQYTFDNNEMLDELMNKLEDINKRCINDMERYPSILNITSGIMSMIDSGYIWQLEQLLIGSMKFYNLIESE